MPCAGRMYNAIRNVKVVVMLGYVSCVYGVVVLWCSVYAIRK